MSESDGKAVFLSYASQDVEPAKRISEALRTAGVEVWFDQEGGLVGGDVWDRKIRQQIAECALFVPIVSANTQARKEGYFRLEWKLAEDRSHLMAKGVPFIVPVSVDGTTERGTLVPDAFLAVQWTKLPGGEAPAAFVARVRGLLKGPTSAPATPARPPEATPERSAPAPASAPPQSPAVAARNVELSPAVQLPTDRAFETFVAQRPWWRRALPILSAVILTAVVAGLVAWRLWPAAGPVTRLTFPLPEGQLFGGGSNRNPVAISPDGTQMVYVANRRLYLRSMSQLEARPIPGTESERGVIAAVFSPDGLSLAFWSSDVPSLRRMSVAGGATVKLCEEGNLSSMSWGPDGIVFSQTEGGIMRVSANGGAPEPLVGLKTGELAYGPQLLPDGRTVLFTLANANGAERWQKGRIVVQRVKSEERKVLIEGGSDARYLPTGHLVYAHRGVVFAVPFDRGRLEIVGGPVPVVEGVRSGNFGNAHFSISATGTLIYRPGPVSAGATQWSLGFFDRKGAAELLKVPPGLYEHPRLSPDGKQIAFGSDDGKEATIWIYELSGASAVRRLTIAGQGNNRFPIWSADSQRVTFQSDREKDLGIFWQRADGASAAERLVAAAQVTACIPEAWSPDGTRLLYNTTGKDSMSALWMFSREDKTSERFGAVESPTSLTGAAFSPDGKWVAYTSRGGMTHAVYVQPFPPTGAKYQISKNEDDGHHPVWSPDGKELFFTPGAGTRLHVVSISTQPAFSFGEAVLLPRPFQNMSPRYERTFDISRDGQRFLGLIDAAKTTPSGSADTAQIQVVLNWFEELKRRVPVK